MWTPGIITLSYQNRAKLSQQDAAGSSNWASERRRWQKWETGVFLKLGFSRTAICRVYAAAGLQQQRPHWGPLLSAENRNLMLQFTQVHNTGQQKMQKCFLVPCFSSSAATFRHWGLRSSERKRQDVFKLHSRSFFSPKTKRWRVAHLIWCKQHKVMDPCCLCQWFRCWCVVLWT